MIYNLLYGLYGDISFFNLFRYITFRTIYGTITAFLICFLMGPWLINKLRRLQIGQYIRECGPESHLGKAGTPTMGGVMILLAIIGSSLLWADIKNPYVWIVLLAAAGFGLIGFTDDYLMQIKKRSKGLSARGKFTLQALLALLIGWLVYSSPGFSTTVTVPFLKNVQPDLGFGYIFFAAFVIVGCSNAVNLTDGLDGLATGPMIIASITYMVFAYVSGHAGIAEYLQIPFIKNGGEMAVLCGATAGAGVGFLWFNSYPAQIFMGDTGSLPLGAILGTIAVITKQEILLVIVGGLFVMEALSVIIQVTYFKLTGGQRIFRMAPLHHHFELKGWQEPKVIVRFWIISAMLALLAVSTLKIR